jgi:hypothetical protein
MCVDCPEDTYSVTIGATNAGVCVPCTSGKYSQKGSVAVSACESCGFYPNCAPGCYTLEVFERNDSMSYNSFVNLTAFAPNNGTQLALFENGTWVDERNPQFVNSSNVLIQRTFQCKECDRGTFSTSGNASVCTSCAMGQYQNELGTTICQNCPSDSWTFLPERQDFSDCNCNAGFTLVNGIYILKMRSLTMTCAAFRILAWYNIPQNSNGSDTCRDEMRRAAQPPPPGGWSAGSTSPSSPQGLETRSRKRARTHSASSPPAAPTGPGSKASTNRPQANLPIRRTLVPRSPSTSKQVGVSV